MDSKIKFIIAFPKSAKYYSYYINNNLQDRHLMKRDEFYFFLADLATDSKLPARIRHYIDINRNFIYNVTENTIQELKNEKLNSINENKEKKFMYNIKEYFRKKEQKEKKKNFSNFNESEMKKLHKQLGIK